MHVFKLLYIRNPIHLKDVVNSNQILFVSTPLSNCTEHLMRSKLKFVLLELIASLLLEKPN